jgi:hypothetical protein
MFSPLMAAETVPSLSLSVEIEGKVDYKNVKGSSTPTQTQTRNLKIEVSTLAKGRSRDEGQVDDLRA